MWSLSSLSIFEFGYFWFFAFCARLLWLAGGCFIFDFLQVGRNIARQYVAAKYRLHARMADDKNNHRLQVCAKMNCLLSQLELLADGSYKFYKIRINAKYGAIHSCTSMCCEDAKYIMWHTQILTLGLQKCDGVKTNLLFRQVDLLYEASAAVASFFATYSAFAGGWMRSSLVMRHSHTCKIFRYHDVHSIFVIYTICLAELSCVLNILLAFGDVCEWRIACCSAR